MSLTHINASGYAKMVAVDEKTDTLRIAIATGEITVSPDTFDRVKQGGLKKGDKRHKLLGSVYFYALLTASAFAIPMSYLHPNYFLFIVSVFTIYMLLTGKRYLQKKSTINVTKTDWLLTILMAIFGTAFIGFGIVHIIKSNFFGIVFIVFGSISYLFIKTKTISQDNLN